jgi:catechol-2,3-dioxygenase
MEKASAKSVQALKAHLVIKDRNSIEFYREMLGIEPSKVRNGYAKFNVENPPLNFTLNEAPACKRARSRTSAFRWHLQMMCSLCARNGRRRDF